MGFKPTNTSGGHHILVEIDNQWFLDRKRSTSMVDVPYVSLLEDTARASNGNMI